MLFDLRQFQGNLLSYRDLQPLAKTVPALSLP